MLFQTTLTQAGAALAAVEPAESMNMTGMMDTLLIVMYICFGFYCIYAYFVQRKTDVLLPGKIICPNGYDPQKCRQPREYLKFMMWRTLALGIGLILFGGMFVLDHFFFSYAPWLVIVLVILPLALFSWYVLAQRKATKRFW